MRPWDSAPPSLGRERSPTVTWTTGRNDYEAKVNVRLAPMAEKLVIGLSPVTVGGSLTVDV